jgi:DNA-directed RNA polymerase specialized sigma24 family protein
MSSNPDTELISRCRRGAAEAWNELFDQHYAATGRFIYQLGPDFTREDVEEICQEVFLSVIKNLLTFNRRSRLQTWIFRIAINRANDYRAKRRAAKRGGGETPLRSRRPTRKPVGPGSLRTRRSHRTSPWSKPRTKP